MNIFLPLLISTIAGLSTMLGSLVIFLKIKPKNINKFISFCLAFSIAIMIGISVTDLIPSSFFTCLKYYSLTKTILIMFLAFIFSYILITLISKKIDKTTSSNNLYKLGILNMLILIFHNLPEGIATFLSSYQDIYLGSRLGLAIMLHNIPEGISIAVPIYYATKSKLKALKSTFLSGVAEPIGALLAFFFLKQFISDAFISIVLIVVGGLMIILSIEEILPKAIKYKETKFIYLGLLAGVITIIINFLLH